MRIAIPKQYVNGPVEPKLMLDLTARPWLDEDRVVYEYRLTVDGEEMFAGSDLRSAVGEAKPPRKTAATLLDFWATYGESLSLRGEQSQYWAEHTEAQRAFLIANYERLSMAVEEWS